MTDIRTALADRYTIDRELGAGGMATVYLAHDLRHDRDVAIKVLHPDLGAALGAARFLSEIRTTARLQHPHILPLLDSGDADGLLYYVMPVVKGETLRARLDRERQLSVPDAVRIAEEVADALEYAHSAGIIHRDIKPENILLHGNHALVADFGISLALQHAGGQRLTETGLSLGTPQYMAPEQAMGEKSIDGRADLYALGCVLYEMLVGEPPFTGPTAQVIVARAMVETARSPMTVRPSIPVTVNDAILTALERLPADRQPSAARFAAQLQGADGAGKTHSHRVRPSIRRGRIGLLAVLAVALIGGLLIGRLWHAPRTDTVVTFNPQTFTPQRVTNARFSPDGRTILYSAVIDTSGPQLFVIRPDYGRPEPLRMPRTNLLAVSSGGEVAVVVRANQLFHRTCIGTLATMSMSGTAPREIRDSVHDADWSPDGRQMAIASFASGNDILEYPVGNVRYRTTGWLSDIRVSPDGKQLAFLEHAVPVDDRGRMVILDLTSGRAVRGADVSTIQGAVWSRDGSEVYSATGRDLHRRIVAYSRSGAMRTVLSGPDGLVMLDRSRDGRSLVTSEQQSLHVMVHRPGTSGVTDESWRDLSVAPMFSADGTILVTEDQSTDNGPNYATMMKRSDGRTVRLGPGEPRSISPDGKFVLSNVLGPPDTPVLYPVGPGAERKLAYGKLGAPLWFAWYPDGSAVLACGRETETLARCYRQPLDGGVQAAATPAIPSGWLYSDPLLAPDGHRILIGNRLFLSATDTGRIVPGLEQRFAVRWTPDGRQLYTRSRMRKIERLDPATGRGVEVLTLGPVSFGELIIGFAIGDNPDLYAYTIWHLTSQLHVVDGIR
jgi:Tol biopolymer transport system component